jgi:hypothetical protein
MNKRIQTERGRVLYDDVFVVEEIRGAHKYVIVPTQARYRIKRIEGERDLFGENRKVYIIDSTSTAELEPNVYTNE